MAKQILFCLILVLGIYQFIDCAVVSKESGAGRSTRDIPDHLLTVRTAGYGGSQYLIRTEKKNWNDASDYCKSQGGYLAEMDSEAEWSHIFAELRNKDPTEGHWLGAKGFGKYGGWRWVKSGNFIPSCPKGVGNWSAGLSFWAPYRAESDCCLYSIVDGHGSSRKKDQGWGDAPCSDPRHFICEFS